MTNVTNDVRTPENNSIVVRIICITNVIFFRVREGVGGWFFGFAAVSGCGRCGGELRGDVCPCGGGRGVVGEARAVGRKYGAGVSFEQGAGRDDSAVGGLIAAGAQEADGLPGDIEGARAGGVAAVLDAQGVEQVDYTHFDSPAVWRRVARRGVTPADYAAPVGVACQLLIDGGGAAVDNARAGGDSSPVDTPIEPSALASPASFPASGIPFHGVYGFPGALRVRAPGGIVARIALADVRRVAKLSAATMVYRRQAGVAPWALTRGAMVEALKGRAVFAAWSSAPVVARLSLARLRDAKLFARYMGWSWVRGKAWTRADCEVAVNLCGGVSSQQVALFDPVAA